jgi:hypothetical protein
MKSLFKSFFIAGLFLTSHFLLLTSVEAHVLKSDGSVGAILHVSPDDDPIAGVSTDFFFELKDKEGKFTPENCDCTAVVLQNGKEIYSQPLFQSNANPSLDDASFSYVLPQKDIYSVQIVGKPSTEGSFQPFTLAWDIRVARESTADAPAQSVSNPVISSIGLLAGVLIVVGIILSKKKKRKQ